MAMSAVAANRTNKTQLAPVQIRSEFETISFEPTVAWDGDKRPENARVVLFVNQFIANGEKPMTSIMATLTLDQAKMMQQTLAEVVKTMEGK